MISLIFAALVLSTPVAYPKADSTCHGSPAHLATDNIPMSADDRATSIINMWFVARSPNDPAKYWIYQLFDGRRFIQARAEVGSQTPVLPYDLRAQRYISLTGLSVYPCFSRPFPTEQL